MTPTQAAHQAIQAKNPTEAKRVLAFMVTPDDFFSQAKRIFKAYEEMETGINNMFWISNNIQHKDLMQEFKKFQQTLKNRVHKDILDLVTDLENVLKELGYDTRG